MRKFTTDELHAMARVAVTIHDQPAEVQDQVLRTTRLVDYLEIQHYTLLREIDAALASFDRGRRAVMLDHLISGKPLLELEPPEAAVQAVM